MVYKYTFDQYDIEAAKTDKVISCDADLDLYTQDQLREPLNYYVLGLCGEAGEVANKVKKLTRDKKGVNEIREDVISELGDCLWYLSRIANIFDYDLQGVAIKNREKLQNREKNGTIHGSGDNR